MKRLLLPALAFIAGFVSLFICVRAADAQDAVLAPGFDAGVIVTAPAVAVSPDTGAATSSDGAVDTLPELKAAYEELRADYQAVKDAKPGEKTVLFAVLLAAILKLVLDGVNALGKYRWSRLMGIVALFLAVPIALLTKYVADKSWISAVIVAASGPGAVVVHELAKLLKKPEPSSAAAQSAQS